VLTLSSRVCGSGRTRSTRSSLAPALGKGRSGVVVNDTDHESDFGALSVLRGPLSARHTVRRSEPLAAKARFLFFQNQD
jgi:hypothetical protein